MSLRTDTKSITLSLRRQNGKDRDAHQRSIKANTVLSIPQSFKGVTVPQLGLSSIQGASIKRKKWAGAVSGTVVF